jgi:hypothetical protein
MMDFEPRYAPGHMDPKQAAQTRARVVDRSDEARAHVEALEAQLPLEVFAQVLDLADQAYSDGIDEAAAHGTAELRAVIDHFPGLKPALQVVADHVGAITTPCAQDGRDPCTFIQAEA